MQQQIEVTIQTHRSPNTDEPVPGFGGAEPPRGKPGVGGLGSPSGTPRRGGEVRQFLIYKKDKHEWEKRQPHTCGQCHRGN